MKRLGLPRSLRYQLLLRSLLLLAALLLLIGSLQFVWMNRFLYQNKAESVENQILSVSKDVWMAGNNPDRSDAADPDMDGDMDGTVPLPEGRDSRGEPGNSRRGREHSLGLVFSNATVALIDASGAMRTISYGMDERAGATPPKLDRNVYASLLEKYPGGDYRIVRDSRGARMLVVLQTVEIRGTHAIVQVAMSTRPLTQLLLRQLFIYLTLALFAILVGWFALHPVLRRTLAPLSRLVSTVEQIDAGRLDTRVPGDQGQIEIDRLSTSFNSMLQRLQIAFEAEKDAKERMRRFVADASHELRTPLTSIHGFLEVLLRGAAGDPAHLTKALASMHGESKRINRLVEELLLLAKLDQTAQTKLEPVPLAELIREMEPQLALLADRRLLELELPNECVCQADADKLKQVVLNLFQNAVQHTDPAAGRIRIELKAEAGFACLEIEDNGAGIAEEDLPHIFDLFFRVDVSRARAHGGAGLGLSISRAIVESFGGTIEVRSESGGGSQFRIRLPAA